MSRKANEFLVLLEKYFTDYLPNVKGLSPNSIRSYKHAFQLLFRFLQEKKGISPEKVTFSTLTADTLEDFLSYLEAERKCSIETRNLRRAAILGFSSYAGKKNTLLAMPLMTSIAEIPKKRVPHTVCFKHFTREEVSILLALPDISKQIGQRDVTLLSLLYASGARAQELCDITLSDITFSKPTKIRLTGKGRKSRIITIPDSCTSILKEYLRAKGMDAQSPDLKDRHLFSSQTHEHMTISCVEGIVKKYVTIAKEKHPDLFPEESYSPHSFRHSIAVHMLEAGDNLVAIKAFLGHASIATTCIYATVTPELANRYLDARGKPIESVSTQICNATLLPSILPYLY